MINILAQITWQSKSIVEKRIYVLLQTHTCLLALQMTCTSALPGLETIRIILSTGIRNSSLETRVTVFTRIIEVITTFRFLRQFSIQHFILFRKFVSRVYPVPTTGRTIQPRNLHIIPFLLLIRNPYRLFSYDKVST